MNDINEKIRVLYERGRAFIDTLGPKLRDGMDLLDIFYIVKTLIFMAEDIINLKGNGEIKHKVVIDLWEEIDVKYSIIDYLLKFIPPIRIRIWFIKITITAKDMRRVIVSIIDKLFIPSLVSFYNKSGWK